MSSDLESNQSCQVDINADEQVSTSIISLKGALTHHSVPKIDEAVSSILFSSSSVIIDLSNIQNSDSSGLVLLLSLLKQAKTTNTQLTFRHIPQQLIDIAKMSGLESVLPTE